MPTTPDLPASSDSASFYEDNQLFTIDNIKQQINFDMFNNFTFKTEEPTKIVDSIECKDEPMSPSDSIPSLDSLPCFGPVPRKQELLMSQPRQDDLVGLTTIDKKCS